jgi:hypothetical protein
VRCGGVLVVCLGSETLGKPWLLSAPLPRTLLSLFNDGYCFLMWLVYLVSTRPRLLLPDVARLSSIYPAPPVVYPLPSSVRLIFGNGGQSGLSSFNFQLEW